MKNVKTKKRKGFLIVRRLAILLFISCVLTACSAETEDNNNNRPLYGFEVQAATDEFYVNDFANIFTDEQKSAMISKAKQLDEETGGIQVVITTTETLENVVAKWSEGFEPENLDIYDIAFQMYEQYGIGRDDMGILVLFSKTEIDSYLATGEKMQIYITDADANRLLYSCGIEEFYNDQFAEWLIALQDGIIQEIRKVVPSNWRGELDIEMPVDEMAITIETKEERERNRMLVVNLLIMVCAIGVVVFLRKRSQKEIRTLKSLHGKAIDKLNMAHQEEMKQYEQEADSTLKSLQEKNRIILEKLENAKKDIAFKNAFLERVQALHPNIAEEVNQMIEDEYKASAQKVDDVIARCINLPADKDNIRVFQEAIECYNATVPNARNYVTADISRLSTLYSKSCELKEKHDREEKEKRDYAIANQTYEKIANIIQGIHEGNYQNYERLDLAYQEYANLTSAQKKYFPDKQMLRDLEMILADAKEDYQNVSTAQEAQRKAQSIVNDISYVDENDRKRLEKAYRYYTNLSRAQREYFSPSLLHEIERLKDEANRDCEMKERRRCEEEYNRQRFYHEQSYGNSLLLPSSFYHSRSNSNHHRAGSTYKPSARSNHVATKVNTPSRTVSRSSASPSVNRGHGGRPSGGGARLTRK